MSSEGWLRASYRVGAAVDGMAAAAMLFPEMGSALYGIDDFDPAADYRYAMRLGASLMLGWTVLLLWADRRPLDRRGVLPITVFVIAGLAWAGAYAVRAGIIPLAGMVPTWFLQSILAVLFLYSYFRSAHASRDDAGGDDRMSLSEAARAFLAQEPIAVAGVSRAEAAPANLIFRRLEQSGRVVYPINPNADHVEGRPCYRSIADLPEPPGAVMIVTHPDDAIDVAQECMRERVPFVWFHRSLDGGSYSPDAAKLCADYGATVIPGGCPMMYLEPVDLGHRCMRGALGLVGKLPSGVPRPRP